MSVRRVRVGKVLRLERRAVDIDPLREYTLIGVYSWGKGIFHRDPQSGSDLGNYRFFGVRPDDLVLSNIQAWEGAIGHASATDADTIGTHRFLTYVPVDPDEIDTNWARYFFLSEAGFPLIQQAAPGSVTRNRTLAIDRFEALEIPLPPIDEQRRIASSLDRGSTSAAALEERVARRIALADALAEADSDALVWNAESLRPLSDLADVNPRTRSPVGAVAFVPMAAVDDVTGAITGAEERMAEELGSGYKRFQRGDVIFARITPCMQNGKSAIFDDERWPIGLGSTEFHVLRPKPGVLAAWVHAVVRTRRFRTLAAERFTGTAGQQRVPAAFLEKVSVPAPDDSADVLERLAHAEDRRLLLRDLNLHQQAVVGSLQPAILNAAFSD